MEPADATRRGRLLVISGPSGSGKSTICRLLLAHPDVRFAVSATTRAMRSGEVAGRDYHFLTRQEFRQLVEAGDFIEWAEVHGNLYGTLRKPLEEALAQGAIYLVEIDVQGALQLKELGVEGVYVFIDVPEIETLRARLEQRGTDAPEVVDRRLHKAMDERRERGKYDHIVVNDDIERAVREIRRHVGLQSQPEAEGGSR